MCNAIRKCQANLLPAIKRKCLFDTHSQFIVREMKRLQQFYATHKMTIYDFAFCSAVYFLLAFVKALSSFCETELAFEMFPGNFISKEKLPKQ